MRNVTRPTRPESLKKGASSWKSELLKAIALAKKDGTDIPESLWKRYDQPDVRRALRSMYGSRCCYCEGRVSHVAPQHIEHRMPKARTKFPERTFDWDNLHLACPACNTSKGSKWDKAAPILDATDVEPISKHLTYRWRFPELRRSPRSKRGTTTIDHAKLNRPDLLEQRSRVLGKLLQTIVEYEAARSEDQAVADELLEELDALPEESEFSSMIEWLIGTHSNIK